MGITKKREYKIKDREAFSKLASAKGLMTSRAKRKTAKENGQKGGRPRQQPFLFPELAEFEKPRKTTRKTAKKVLV